MSLQRFSLSADVTQRFCVLLALDGLRGIWRDMGLLDISLDLVTTAATDAVRTVQPAFKSPSHDVAEALLNGVEAAGGDAAVRVVWQWFEGLGGAPHAQSLAYWAAWMQDHAGGALVPGMPDDWLDAMLTSYQQDVLAVNAAFLVMLKAKVAPLPLSDWDMGLHADHHLCFQALADDAAGVTLLALQAEQDCRLMTAFVRKWAQMVPGPMQQDLWRGVSDNLATADPMVTPALAKLPPYDMGTLHALGDH
jgi:hypothetical protein